MAVTFFRNFSACCVNTEFIGFSVRQDYIDNTITYTPGSSYHFETVSGCSEINCTNIINNSCFTYIDLTFSPTFVNYTFATSATTYSDCEECLTQYPCEVQEEIIYFQFCCSQGVRAEDNYFGILTESGTFQLGATGFMEISSIAACVTTVSSQGLPQSITIFQNIPYNFTSYKDCRECTGSTVGCSTTPLPTPTIYFSSDTRCGDNILRRNECDPIVIFPLGVSCVGTNPTLTTDANGELSLIITGGTPPYDVFWSNGSNGLFITNLSVGSYSAIVTDYYRDFTAYTTCTLTAPTPVPTTTPTETPTPTPVPEGEPFCLSITTDEYIPTSVQYYFYPTGNIVNGRPEYTDGNGHDIIWNLSASSYWSLGNPPGSYEIVTYDIPDPPLTGWQFVDGPTGTIVSNLGQCPGYPNLCLNFMQIKDSTSPVYSAQQTMVYNGIVNGRPSWLSLDGLYIISWDLGYWRVVTSEPLWNTMANSNPQIPPIAGWALAGSVNPASFVNVTQGNCTPSAAAAAQPTFGNENARTNQPTENPDLRSTTSYNGNILLRATSGTGPFQYSIDGGLTYRTIPLFTKLSPGTYSTVIKDVSGRTTFSTVILAEPPSPVIYQVSLQTQSTKQRNNSVIYTSTIKTSPALPSGVTITFDLVHTNTFRTSTTSTAATMTNSSLMKRNGRSFSANTTTTVTSTTLNTLAGCQDKTIFIRGKTETWSSVNYTSTTTLSFESTTLITKNLIDKCYIGDATDNFVITNLTISGCSSCGVVNGSV